jgi:hypothetical protein
VERAQREAISDATCSQALGHGLFAYNTTPRSEPDAIGVPRDEATGRWVVGGRWARGLREGLVDPR